MNNIFGATFCARGLSHQSKLVGAENSCHGGNLINPSLLGQRIMPQHREGVEAGKCGAVEVHVSGLIILLRAARWWWRGWWGS